MVDEVVRSIHWLGHDTFRIDAEQQIYFDPYEIGAAPKADLVLVTHAHGDHCSPGDVARLQQAHTVLVTEKDSARKLEGDVRVVAPGQHVTVGDVQVEAVPAYNLDKAFHPRAKGWLGFIVTVNGVRVYHAGDTDHIPEMAALEVDIALLPVSGTYVMTAAEAVRAALDINPQVAIPMHYGAIVGGASDADQFKSGLEGKVEVVILPKEG
jgi:L-ascorbate metabolism protein UlaG (beta-lactamase superfamily)